MFGFNKPKPFFSAEENLQVVNAIKRSETTTSGEIRVYIEAKNPYVEPMDRAREIFAKLQMEHTADRNAVLVYLAHRHREIALYADEGIYNKVGHEFWEMEIDKMVKNFSADDLAGGIEQCVIEVCNVLQHHFPYDREVDKNELPDEIIFGKL